jgi:hypothetical protein
MMDVLNGLSGGSSFMRNGLCNLLPGFLTVFLLCGIFAFAAADEDVIMQPAADDLSQEDTVLQAVKDALIAQKAYTATEIQTLSMQATSRIIRSLTMATARCG